MPNNWTMEKRRELKDDDRYVIYYSFKEKKETSSDNKPCKCCGSEKKGEEA